MPSRLAAAIAQRQFDEVVITVDDVATTQNIGATAARAPSPARIVSKERTVL